MPAAIDTCLPVADEHRFPGPAPHRHARTSPASSKTRWRRSAAARSTCTTRKAPAAATRRTSSASPACANCLPSSTNPTNPYTVNTFDEHLDMTMVCHHLNPAIPEDVAFAESRIRAADHRRGGRAARHRRDLDAGLRQPGHGPHQRGDLPDLAARQQDEGPARPPARKSRRGFGDNERIRRYIAKYTINAARTFGIADHVGSLEDGKLADIVVWRPAFFGIKPELVIKGGFIAWGAMGD